MVDNSKESLFEVTYDEEGYCGVRLEEFEQLFRKPTLYEDSASTVSDGDGEKIDLEGLMSVMHKIATNIESSHLGVVNIRRIIWGYFLGLYDNPDLDNLCTVIRTNRERYLELTNKHRYDGLRKMQTLNPQLFHPLAPVERNPWEITQRIKELLDEIWQDVERTYQERSLFKQESVRKSLQNILYVWSREHDYISYRQGMNELLAVIYLVCYRDQVHNLDSGKDASFDVILSGDMGDLEADAYMLFDALMSLETQLMFDNVAVKSPQIGNSVGISRNMYYVASIHNRTKAEAHNSFIARTKFIFGSILRLYDMPLFTHFQKIELEPHIFLMRWIRLIFSREFNINDTLNLWDAVFADHFLTRVESRGLPEFQFELMDFFSIAMISYVRLNLLENDINYCLQRLFKFPPMEDISHLIAKAHKIRVLYRKRLSDPGDPSVYVPSAPATPLHNFIDTIQVTSKADMMECRDLIHGNTPYASLEGSEGGFFGYKSPSFSSDSSSSSFNQRASLEDIASRLFKLHERLYLLGL
eukprot:XP_001609861.1 hypothetical protein [Babesia bovis T2Bo]